MIPKGSHIGGVGGGNLLDRNVDTTVAIPWSLPKDDQTWVQLNREKADALDDGGDKQPKYTSGSLYSIIREIEAKSTTPVRLTSFGEVKPKSEGDRHSYEFATPPGVENHRALDYVAVPIRTDKAPKQNCMNMFQGLAHRDHGLGDGHAETFPAIGRDAALIGA